MSATIDTNGAVTLTGDGFGVNYGLKQLAAAPSTAVKMQFVSRIHFVDAPTANQYNNTAGWDPRQFFGLGFDNTIYDFSGGAQSTDAIPTGFLGVSTLRSAYYSGGTYSNDWRTFNYLSSQAAAPWGYYSGSVGHRYGLTDGNNALIFGDNVLSSNDCRDELCSFPINATQGAMATYMWEVWGSSSDKTVYSRFVKDTTSLAEGDAMFAAMSGKTAGVLGGNILEHTVHGDVTSNWRNANGTMNFPRWLKIKYSYPSYSLRLKYWKIRYLDAADTVVYEQAP